MTIFRSQTDEQLAARWDDAPFITDFGRTNMPIGPREYAPRVECIPSRDRDPFVRTYNGAFARHVSAEYAAQTPRRYTNGFNEIVVTRYSPRPEFARPPVNPILVDFREHLGVATLWLEWLDGGFVLEPDGNLDALAESTPAEIEHARKVLTRLVAGS